MAARCRPSGGWQQERLLDAGFGVLTVTGTSSPAAQRDVIEWRPKHLCDFDVGSIDDSRERVARDPRAPARSAPPRSARSGCGRLRPRRRRGCRGTTRRRSVVPDGRAGDANDRRDARASDRSSRAHGATAPISASVRGCSHGMPRPLPLAENDQAPPKACSRRTCLNTSTGDEVDWVKDVRLRSRRRPRGLRCATLWRSMKEM